MNGDAVAVLAFVIGMSALTLLILWPWLSEDDR